MFNVLNTACTTRKVLLTFLNAHRSDSVDKQRIDLIRVSVIRSKQHTASIGDFLQQWDEVYSAQPFFVANRFIIIRPSKVGAVRIAR